MSVLRHCTVPYDWIEIPIKKISIVAYVPAMMPVQKYTGLVWTLSLCILRSVRCYFKEHSATTRVQQCTTTAVDSVVSVCYKQKFVLLSCRLEWHSESRLDWLDRWTTPMDPLSVLYPRDCHSKFGSSTKETSFCLHQYHVVRPKPVETTYCVRFAVLSKQQ